MRDVYRKLARDRSGWHVVSVAHDENLRTIEEVASEIADIVERHIADG